jgi:hypothetical protein
VTTRASAKRRPVVLYQPRDEGSVMPLGLLALGSWLTGEHVVIVDGRFELAPEARIVELARGALCLGITVRTGSPVREALRVTAAARAARPDLPVVWGGPHASANPAACLGGGAAAACATGAGEEALAAAATALRAGHTLRSVAGLGDGEGPQAGPASPPAHLWPRADYTLLDVERYLERRGARRLDYCSSRGARDGERWMAIRAERVVSEATELAERYRLSEVLFQDEDFFAEPERVEAIARGLVEGEVRLGWQAGARPADVAAASPELLRLLAASGCRRLHLEIGAGSAAPDLLLEAGTRLHAAGLRARFVFEVTEPRAGRDDLTKAVSVARSLCAMDGRFETPVRRAWSAGEAPWSDPAAERRLARTSFFFAEAQREPGRRLGKHLLRLLALLRVRLGFFGLDVDRFVVQASAVLRTGRPRATGTPD